MDPYATLAIILNPATVADEFAEARENLNRWLDNGGFKPRVSFDCATYAVVYCGTTSATVVRVKPLGRLRADETTVSFNALTLAA
jgi:hypothetical protein